MIYKSIIYLNKDFIDKFYTVCTARKVHNAQSFVEGRNYQGFKLVFDIYVKRENESLLIDDRHLLN